jgi:RNA polymerase sigma-70 factor (ECF subfamily)
MAYQDMTDSEIMEKIRRFSAEGEESQGAMEPYAREIYRRYYQQAYQLSRYYGLPRHEAEDCVQDSFIKLFRIAGNFDSTREFKPYFFKIVINTVRDCFNERKKNRYRDIEQMEDIPEEKDKEIFEKFHIRDQMNGIISRMPENLRSVLVLRVYGDLDFDSIAGTLGIGVRQLHNRLNRAYEYLRTAVEEER